MEKNNDNDNKNVSKLPISKDTEVVETVEKPKKPNVNLNGHLNEKQLLKNV